MFPRDSLTLITILLVLQFIWINVKIVAEVWKKCVSLDRCCSTRQRCGVRGGDGSGHTRDTSNVVLSAFSV